MRHLNLSQLSLPKRWALVGIVLLTVIAGTVTAINLNGGSKDVAPDSGRRRAADNGSGAIGNEPGSVGPSQVGSNAGQKQDMVPEQPTNAGGPSAPPDTKPDPNRAGAALAKAPEPAPLAEAPQPAQPARGRQLAQISNLTSGSARFRLEGMDTSFEVVWEMKGSNNMVNVVDLPEGRNPIGVVGEPRPTEGARVYPVQGTASFGLSARGEGQWVVTVFQRLG